MIGLGRSIFSILEKSQVEHAREIIHQRLAKHQNPLANFVTTTLGGQLLRIQMVPVFAGGAEEGERAMTGYVLTVDNITRALEEEARRDQALHALTEGSRAALGSIRAAVANLIDYPDMDAELRERFVKVVDDEAAQMSRRLDETMSEFSDSSKTRWPLEDVLAIDIIAAAQRRIESKLDLVARIEDVDESLWIKADSYSLVFALTFIAERLLDHYQIRDLRFRTSCEGKLVYLDAIWVGQAVSSETFYSWEMENMQALGETSAACATYGELTKKFPKAAPTLMTRVANQRTKLGCQ